MTLLTFIIPVRHQDNARDWAALTAKLTQTARSIAGQRAGGWRGLVVANEGAALPPLPDGFEVVRVDFPPNPHHDLAGSPREAVLDAFRLDKGRRVLAGMLRARESGFFMIVDDDDFVSASIAGHVAAHPEANGWNISRGWVWADGGALVYAQDGFDHWCGTSLIVRSSLYQLPARFEDASEEYIKTMLGSHLRIARQFAEKGTPLRPLPFRGAIYRVAHAGAHSQSRGLVRKYFLNAQVLRRPWLAVARLPRLRPFSARLRREFCGRAGG